ncbi:hypothetical protein QTP81_14735 [Alteromonas sp. ASW11-36]|uniref:DUF2306 domain-containing protein n=1 Tax=Alteromonas arenosi TaxID=3055817 RepID=A0ABT7T0A7_9ALTE|nr:hypothetical protein [Alteromonas sp. ASW11-36]MDM7861856.1 hypothetical protein [Alteromonas sp. ASW11-36]
MANLHSFLFIIHVVFGGAALVLFWIPVLTKKGQLNHIQFGRYYRTAMYTVAASGALMAMMVLMWPMTVKGDLFTTAHDPQIVIERIRVLWGFLLYLSLLSFTSTRHGMQTLNAKADRSILRRWHFVVPLIVLFVGGVLLAVLGYLNNRTLHIVFGILGVAISGSMLRYCFKATIKPGEWVIEHLSAMIGSGIGAYTAFLAFGGRVIFSDLGAWQMVFWIAPGVIGGIAASVIAQKYAKQMGLAKRPNIE